MEPKVGFCEEGCGVIITEGGGVENDSTVEEVEVSDSSSQTFSQQSSPSPALSQQALHVSYSIPIGGIPLVQDLPS